MLALLSGSAIRFLAGPAGKVVMLALAFLAWTLYQRHDATQDCKAEEYQEQLVESQRQLAIANQIVADARKRADTTEAEMSHVETLYEDLKNRVQGDPDIACPIPPDVRERLLRIK